MASTETGTKTFYGDVDALRTASTAIFRAAGLDPRGAALVTDNLIHADLRGHPSHGVTRIPIYVSRLETGVVNMRPEITVTRPRPTTALVDADNGMGAIAGDRAVKEAMAIAAEHGLGAATVRHSNHNGPGSFYAAQLPPRGMIGVSATNSPKSMAVWGSRGRALGTNPLTVAVPAGRHPALVLDMSSSVVARGKIVEASKRGERIPEGWALDTAGRPTTDAKAAEAGVVLPFAGAKGSAVAIMVDVLAGVLSGAAFGGLINNLYADFDNPQNNGQFVLALDVAAFMPLGQFAERMDAMIDMLEATPHAEGVDEILMPGEPEARNEARIAASGIPLAGNVVAEIESVAARLGVTLPPLSPRPLDK